MPTLVSRQSWRVVVFSLLLLTVAVTGLRGQPETPAGNSWLELTVIHFNDFHASFEPRKFVDEKGQPREVGGIARLVGCIKALRAEAEKTGERLLVVDAGDFHAGQVLDSLSKSAASLDFRNVVRVDAATLGNHEFDRGDMYFMRLYRGELGVAAANFPLVCANLKGPNQPWSESKVIEVGAVRVGITGLITPSLPTSVMAGAVANCELERDLPHAVNRALDRLKGQTDVNIVLSHCGVDVDRAWLPKTEGRVQLVVSGHSHTKLPNGEAVGTVPMVSAEAYGRYVGRVKLRLDATTKAVASWKAELIELRDDDPRCAPDAATAKLLDDKLRELRPMLDRKVADVAAPMSNLQRPESALGVWMAQAMLKAVPGAQIGVMNLHGVRQPLETGTLAVRQLHEVAPFGNTIVRIKLTGRDLINGVTKNLERDVLQLANATVEYCPLLPPNRRVVRVLVGGVEVDPEAEYVVVTNNYVGGQQDKFFARKSPAPVEETGLIDVEVFIRQAEQEGVISPDKLGEAVYRVVPPPQGAAVQQRSPEDTPLQGFVLGSYEVEKVMDGDTISVKGLDRSLRFHGVDAEETFKPHGRTTVVMQMKEAESDFGAYCKKMRGDSPKPVKFATPMGEATKEWTKNELEGVGKVTLEVDDPSRAIDVYGRWIVYVFYQKEKDGPRKMLNLELVRQGFTPYFCKYGYLKRFDKEFKDAEQEARKAKRNIWADAAAVVPKHYPDYTERCEWWKRCADALKKLEDDRAKNPETAPLDIEGGRADSRLEQSVGKEVEVATHAPVVNQADGTVTLSYKKDADFNVWFTSKDLFSKLWKPEYTGEVLRVKGKLIRDKKGWAVLVEKPENIGLYK